MKKILILAGCIMVVSAAKSQVTWGGTTPGTGWTPSTVRVGGSSNPATGTTFHVGSGTGSLHYTGGGDGAMVIQGSSGIGDRAILELHDPGQYNNTIFQALGYGTYLGAATGKPLFLQTGGGNLGVGPSITLNYKVDVQATALNDGVGITQSGTSAAALHLSNTNSNGQHWALFSAGSANSQGAGNFSIFEYGATDRLFIDGSTGNVGISTITPGRAKLNVYNIDPIISAGIGGTRWGVLGTISPQQAKISDGYDENDIGVEGDATTSFTGQQLLYGVLGRASNGLDNYGGYFEATLGDNTHTGAANFGVKVKATGNNMSYGIYSEASGATVVNWAGYFQGNVNINGAAFCTSSAWSSDQKLKQDIKAVTDGLEKIRLLKPSTYTFKKDDEFKGMNLPEGQQLGLIAQDLEKVYPYLVTELAENVQKNEKGEVTNKIPSHKVVNYIGLIPVLISAMQEQDQASQAQQQTIDQLKDQVNKQTQVNADLQNQIEELKQQLAAQTGANGAATGIATNGGVDAGFQMAQNEPNPFTQETVVKYTLPQTVSNASMVVYDLTGKQITTFPITQKGASQMTITSEKLAAGIYIYSIVADGKVMDSKRMIVAGK